MAKQQPKIEVKMSSEKNTDELVLVNEKMKENASDFKRVLFPYSEVGDEIIRQSEVILKLMEKAFGSYHLRPVIAAVPTMFDQLMQEKRPKDYIPILEDFKTHSPGSLNDLLKAKYTYEKNTHKNQNDYTNTCIQGGAALETAKANWQFAVNTFYEDKQNSETALKEAIYASRKSHKDIFSQGDLESKIDYHVDYFSEALEISAAITSYAKTMDTANTTLTTAFASLITTFNKYWNVIAAGELSLITANRKGSKDLWVSIQSNYKKK